MKIMVSACLIGEKVKYSGGSNFSEPLSAFLRGHAVIPVCPEILGGLPIPREPAEIVNGIPSRRTGRSETRGGRKARPDHPAVQEPELRRP